MFIKKYDGPVNPFALPGLLNDYRMNLKPDVMTYELDRYLEIALDGDGIITAEMVKSKTRKREVVMVRQAFCHLAKKYSKLPLKTIGEFIGGRDHTTVIHSVQTVKDLMETDDHIRWHIMKLESQITLIDRPNDLMYSIIGIKDNPYNPILFAKEVSTACE